MATPGQALSQKALVGISPAFGNAALASSPRRSRRREPRPDGALPRTHSSRLAHPDDRLRVDARASLPPTALLIEQQRSREEGAHSARERDRRRTRSVTPDGSATWGGRPASTALTTLRYPSTPLPVTAARLLLRAVTGHVVDREYLVPIVALRSPGPVLRPAVGYGASRGGCGSNGVRSECPDSLMIRESGRRHGQIFGRVRAHWRPLEKATARSDAAGPPECPRFLSMKRRPAGHDVRICRAFVTLSGYVPSHSIRAAPERRWVRLQWSEV